MANLPPIENAFRSKRLTYRRIRDDDDDKKFLFDIIQSDPGSWAIAQPGLLRPPKKQDCDEMIKGFATKPLLAVIIHSFVREESIGDSGAIDQGKDNAIGFLIIGGNDDLETRHNRVAAISIFLTHPYRNKGYGSEVINWALDWGFRHANLHRVSIGTASCNQRAAHLYAKLGFKEEGRSREALWYDRAWHDQISYGMLDREWEVLRGLRKE